MRQATDRPVTTLLISGPIGASVHALLRYCRGGRSRVDPTMADTVDRTEQQRRVDSRQDERSRFEALTRTLEARDLADTPERWPDALSPGSVLGMYRIVRVLGQGGMGVVYEAEEIDTGRSVALKVLSAVRRRDVDRARFLREGRLAASLNHPHCVFVFGAWEIDGELAISMELMRETLADRQSTLAR